MNEKSINYKISKREEGLIFYAKEEAEITFSVDGVERVVVIPEGANLVPATDEDGNDVLNVVKVNLERPNDEVLFQIPTNALQTLADTVNLGAITQPR